MVLLPVDSIHLPEFQHIVVKCHHLSEALVVVPPQTFMAKIDKIMDGLLNQYVQNSTESRNLVTICDALLPKLMSGETRVNS